MNRKQYITKLIAAGMIFAVAGFGAPLASAAESVSLRLNFSPWAMHAQYFAALNEGFYDEEGLDVEILPRSAGQQNEVLVGSGQNDFGVTNADAFIKARANGIPIVAISLDQPDTAFALFSLESSGITEPADLKGKTIAVIQGDVVGLLDPLLDAGGLTRDDVEILSVRFGSEQQLVASGEADAALGFFYGQPITMAARGLKTNVMLLRDYGVNLYGTLVFTNESLLEENPDTVERFLRSTLKGWMWTAENKEKAMEYVIAEAPDRDYGVELEKLHLIYDFYKAPMYRDRFGVMSDDGWAASIRTLSEAGELEGELSPSDLYTNEVLQRLPQAEAFSDILMADE